MLAKSSSGGIFFELAQTVLTAKGLIVGAAFECDGIAVLKCAETQEQLACLLGSKYVQSRAEKVYSVVKTALKENRQVLFSGTPCQCNALMKFLGGKHPSNLFIVDFICHGVPSEKVFQGYLSYLSGEKHLCSLSCRDKRNGWGCFGLKVGFTDGTEYYKNHTRDAYYNLFVSNHILRPSCYVCSAKGKNRAADITLGDFWGGQDLNPMGSSVVLVNTESGHAGFNAIKHRIHWKEIPFESAVRKNKSYYEPCTIPFDREKVFRMFRNNPSALFEHADDYAHAALAERILRKILLKARLTYNRVTPKKSGYLDLPGTERERSFSEKAKCCGCGACAAICPSNAIVMTSDSEGFLYPSTDTQLCCRCEKCRSICPNGGKQKPEES